MLALFLLSSQVTGVELITNGAFETNTDGWTNWSNGTGSITIGNYDISDPDNEVLSYKNTDAGYSSIFQIVPSPNLDIVFSTSAAFWDYCEDNSENYYAASAVILYYLKEDETALGETRIYAATQYCPWQNTSTTHLYPVHDTLWNDYSFNITDELANLPGVPQDSIKELKVSVYSFTTTHC